MHIIPRVVVVFFCFSTSLFSQSVHEATAVELQRFEYAFTATRRAFSTNELEASEEQKRQFANWMDQRLKVYVSRFKVNVLDPLEREASVLQMHSQMKELDRELKEEILLPHQVKWLHEVEFENLLRIANGNYSRVILTFFKDQFKLTAAQLEDLKLLKEESDQEMQKIRQEFEEKVKALRAKSLIKVKGVFTAEQLKVLDTVNGDSNK